MMMTPLNNYSPAFWNSTRIYWLF